MQLLSPSFFVHEYDEQDTNRAGEASMKTSSFKRSRTNGSIPTEITQSVMSCIIEVKQQIAALNTSLVDSLIAGASKKEIINVSNTTTLPSNSS